MLYYFQISMHFLSLIYCNIYLDTFIKLKIFKYKNRELRINLSWRILYLRQKDTDPL